MAKAIKRTIQVPEHIDEGGKVMLCGDAGWQVVQDGREYETTCPECGGTVATQGAAPCFCMWCGASLEGVKIDGGEPTHALMCLEAAARNKRVDLRGILD